MDGLDNRGQVVVIGATNRIDSIDPALRRPGRFDRELKFGLPTLRARRSILDIHTRKWDPPLAPQFKQELAERSVGYCGADIKALCAEASLHALRRRYPQIYHSADKLVIDVKQITVLRKDFAYAMRTITPASHRSTVVRLRPLQRSLVPLLSGVLDDALRAAAIQFPVVSKSRRQGAAVADAASVAPLDVRHDAGRRVAPAGWHQ